MQAMIRYKLVIRDKEGRVLISRKGRSRSYVIAFLDILNASWRVENRSITDTGGTSRTWASNNTLNLTAAANTATYGPVVGTGTTAVAITDTKLETQIAEGSGAGQMNYQVTSVSTPSTSGSTRLFTVQRVFINNSGGAITIQECGIYGREYLNVSWYFCVVRDLVSGGLAVPNGGSATLTYTLGITA